MKKTVSGASIGSVPTPSNQPGKTVERRLYRLPDGSVVGKEGAEAYAKILELKSRCTENQNEQDLMQRIKSAEDAQKERDKRRAETMAIENERDRHAKAEKYAENALREREEKIAAGLIEVRVDPGSLWDAGWMQREILHRVPEINLKGFPPELGCGAILRAVAILEDRKREGRTVKSPSGFVISEAQKAMRRRGGPTIWVTPEEAQQKPHLIVDDWQDTFAGRVSARWQAKQENAMTKEGRRRRGLC